MLEKYLTWFRAHERLLIVGVVLAVGAWGFNHWIDASAAKAEARATVAEQTLAAQKATDAQLAVQNAQMQAQYQVLVDRMVAQNAALANAVAARQTALAAQQGSDAHLPVSGLATRLESLGNAPSGSISSTETTVTLSQPGALAVVQTLETVPVLQADLKDEKAIAANTQKELDAQGGIVVSLNKQVDSLNLTVKDDDKACKAQVDSVKADARKSKRNWFIAGFISGFLIRVATAR